MTETICRLRLTLLIHMTSIHKHFIHIKLNYVNGDQTPILERVSYNRGQSCIENTPMDDFLLTGEPDDFSFLQNVQGPLERVARVSLLRDKLLTESSVSCCPAQRQPSADIAFDTAHFFVELSS